MLVSDKESCYRGENSAPGRDLHCRTPARVGGDHDAPSTTKYNLRCGFGTGRSFSRPYRHSPQHFFYLRSRTKTDLSYVIQSTQLLGGAKSALPSEVTVSFGGTQIQNLIKINYIFWNSGNRPITMNDLVPTSPISVSFSEHVRVLKPSILHQSTNDNAVTLTANDESPTRLQCSFRFLEPNHGFNIEILCSGRLEEPAATGTIIGMPQGLKNLTGRERSTFRQFLFGVGPTFIASSVIFLPMILLPNLPKDVKAYIDTISDNLLIVFIIKFLTLSLLVAFAIAIMISIFLICRLIIRKYFFYVPEILKT